MAGLLLAGLGVAGAAPPDAPAASLAGAVAEAAGAADLLAVDADMDAYLAARVDRSAPAPVRLEQLVDALIGPRGLHLAYTPATYTAAEAFHRREANCLSFTSLFVALARRAGLAARFQEVDVPPDWSLQGDTLVLDRHVNAVVTSRGGGQRVVDFDIGDFRAGYPRRVISDARALAHYYNNLGAARLATDPEAARAYLARAIAADPEFAAAWVNLGALRLRAGEARLARAAWQRAQAVDPRELAALSNLERLEREQGELAAADALRGRIERYRLDNPYYRYHLAQLAYAREDWPEAIAQLKIATRRQPGEDRFLALLGLACLRAGDTGAARRWFARAVAAAADETTRRRYQGKLEMLRRAAAG